MDKAAQLEACKAAASNYRSRLQTAATKDEALTLAIGVAENLMKALKLSSSSDEKKQLKSQCAVIMDVTDRIKNAKDWTPLIKQQQPEINRHEQIGQWATNVTITAGSTNTHDELTSQLASSYCSSSSTTLSAEQTSNASGRSAPSSILPDRSKRANELKQSGVGNSDVPASLTNPSDQQTPFLGNNVLSSTSRGERTANVKTPPISSPEPSSLPVTLSTHHLHGQIGGKAAFQSPLVPSYSQIRRLIEPISSRKRTKKEDIILLKASIVNGFKCPPWDKNPFINEFIPQEGTGLFNDTRELSLSAYQQQFFKGWLHAQDAVPPPSMFSGDRSRIRPSMSSEHPIDLVQDAASDCSVIASLCAGTARAERGHDQMLANKLYPFDKQLGKPVLSANGKYVVRLNFNGCWRKVVIDDRLPVSSTHRVLHVIDRRNPALLWPPLLEKAYLKVRGGYDFPGSNSCSDLWTFTGWVPEQIFLQETNTVPGQLWNRMYKAFLYGDVLVTAGTGKMSTKQEREFGLEGQHSYVVLDMRETDHDRLLLIKNPWAEGKGWRGPRPASVSMLDSSTNSGDSQSSVETYHRDSVPTSDRPYPTTFWIGLEQVIQHFDSLYLNWNPGLFRYRQDIHFEWAVDTQQLPSGCIVNHPQFALFSKGADLVWLLLSRHFRDAPADSKDGSDTFNDGSIRTDSQVNASGESSKGYMSVYVCNGHGERLYIKDTYLESSDYVTTPQCLLRWDTDANSAYTIVVDQDNLPPSPYTFSLSAFSNSAITLEPAMQKYPVQKIEQGAWTRQTAGGSTSSPRYFENPQYTLEVRERGSLAILLTSTKHEHALHVKLALGHGKRLSRLQNRDVMVDSGNHRNGCVFAEMKDVQPGLYTIICSLFEAGHTGDFTLRIDSSNEVGLKQVPRDGAGLLSMKLTPACFGPNVHKIAAPLAPHRLASYTIIARFAKATSPRSVDLGKLARSPLRLSVELGRGPERKFLIASERGEYADSATVRSESVNIEPGMGGDLWLVLDRLSGPGGAVEEWYDVEMYLDTAQACTVGVWRNWDD